MARLSRSGSSLLLATLAAASALAACGSARRTPAGWSAADPNTVLAADVRAVEYTLAADSMEGRNTGRPGSMKAARYIAAWFAQSGLTPAGDSGFFQRVPMRNGRSRGGRLTATALPSFADLDTVPAAERLYGGNVVGVLEGSDPALRDQVVLVDAHYDHLGIGAPEQGDSIYNGADDDASGTAAVMFIARALAKGPRPKRTVVFMATTGEETGLVGTRWYIAHPVRPLEKTVANLEIEMIGRPDSLAGGAGKAWLTGYERSTMGDALKANGIPIVPDPRPAQQFFTRSDNIAFAYRGIPAHTLSTFNLHTDYHHAKDEADRLDYDHMAAVIQSAVGAVRLLTDGPRPEWKPGGKPEQPEQSAPRPRPAP
jgi:hypothetical protein